MTLPPQLCPTYDSGADFTVTAGPVRFSFDQADFTARVRAAAVRLGFVVDDELTPADIEDLVTLAAHGHIERTASPLAEHVEAFQGQLLGRERNLVQWLRRLVVREAWIDDQVRAGRLAEDPHRAADSGIPGGVLAGEPVPDLSELAFRGGDS